MEHGTYCVAICGIFYYCYYYYFRKQSGSAYFGIKYGIDVVVGSRVSAITA